MYEALKQAVLAVNRALPQHQLVVLTWGNASAIDRVHKHVVIKPSGVSYDALEADMLVVLDLDGNVLEGNLRSSSDTPTHLELYRNFPGIGSIIHTHSEWATSWAQAGLGIPVYGSTHGDYFFGDIPCTRDMQVHEVEENYELHTGKLIVETFQENSLDPDSMPGILVKNHGPFVWGRDTVEALEHAIVFEAVAKMAYRARTLEQKLHRMPQYLLDKHYLRKHGNTAYYGQKDTQE